MSANNENLFGSTPKKVSDLLQETLASFKPEQPETQLEEEARLWFEEIEAKNTLRGMEEFYEAQCQRKSEEEWL